MSSFDLLELDRPTTNSLDVACRFGYEMGRFRWVRNQGGVARRHRCDGGAHSLGHEALQVGVDEVVVG